MVLGTRPNPGNRHGQGAVMMRTEKGLKVERVAVKRYQAGQRPRYADSVSDGSDDDDVFNEQLAHDEDAPDDAVISNGDTRLTRIMSRTKASEGQGRRRHRQEDDEDENGQGEADVAVVVRTARRKAKPVADEAESEDDDDAAERRRARMRMRAREREVDGVAEEGAFEAMAGGATLVGIGAAAVASSSGAIAEGKVEGGAGSSEESASSEYETDTEDDETDNFKPVFVRKTDRVTVKEREAQAAAEAVKEKKKTKRQQDRAKHTRAIAAESVKRVIDEEKPESSDEELTDSDGNNEEDHEAWKVRELKRMKRARDERETKAAEKERAERRKTMTVVEVEADIAREGGKVVTNAREKGKMKYLQKYYHKGAFFLDQEDELFKRDTTAATGEDHFNKAVLPKVMQVKNFGRMGRTKYTHLLDQDTSIMRSKDADGSDVYGAVDQYMRSSKDTKNKLSGDSAFKRPGRK